MTIVYIHGVKVRDPQQGVRLEKPFRRWLAPKISVNGAEPDYIPVYWGDAAARFRWELDARPRTALLGMGGGTGFPGLGSLREASARTPLDQPAGGAAASGPVLGATPAAPAASAPPLSSVPVARRGDFLADLYLAARPRSAARRDPLAEEPFVAAIADAAASVAAEWDKAIAAEQTEAARAARLVQAVDAALAGDKLLAMGALQDWMSRAGETLTRAASWPGDAVSTVFAELRPVLNEFVAYFVGDVLAYVHGREAGGRPGEIPRRVLDALKSAHRRKKRTGEPIVVVTHSMGGQLFYDAVTFFAASEPKLAELEIDHWISCGAQVSFFAELGLFKGQPDTRKPHRLQRPAAIAAWTNFYDRNDLVGFVMEPVFAGVKDVEYDTGYGLAFAHTGFLARPSFFEAIADRIGRGGS
ncbi:MAG: hypothetical protein L6R19_15175 [Alphaproteobacteria bacterium]|nr:hypothetical protein [Alphaproteobacteria bacterium]